MRKMENTLAYRCYSLTKISQFQRVDARALNLGTLNYTQHIPEFCLFQLFRVLVVFIFSLVTVRCTKC